jgi:hypothetical protein
VPVGIEEIDGGDGDPGLKGEAENHIMLVSPEPFSSGAADSLRFEVDVPKDVLHSDVEASVRVQMRAGDTIGGSFAWSPRHKPGTPRKDFVLTYTPHVAFPAGTDFVVTVSPTGTFKPAHALYVGAMKNSRGEWTAGFSTAIVPRVAWVRVVSKDLQNATTLHWRMSEMTDVPSIEKGLVVTVGGAPVSGLLDLKSGYARDFQYTFSQPVPLSADIVFALGPDVKGPTGAALDMGAWIAGGLATDRFAVSMRNLAVCQHEPGCWEWRPSVGL